MGNIPNAKNRVGFFLHNVVCEAMMDYIYE